MWVEFQVFFNFSRLVFHLLNSFQPQIPDLFWLFFPGRDKGYFTILLWKLIKYTAHKLCIRTVSSTPLSGIKHALNAV